MGLHRPTPEELGSMPPDVLGGIAADCLAQLEPGDERRAFFRNLALTTDPDEAADIAAVFLERREPGRQPFPLFTQFARLYPMSTVEIVPFSDLSTDDPLVLLGERGSKDSWWANQLGLPGGAVLETDEIKDVDDFDTPSQRVIRDEFAGSIVVNGEVLPFKPIRRAGVRGKEMTALCVADVSLAPGFDEPVKGQFFSTAEVLDGALDDRLIVSHYGNIKSALKAARRILFANPSESY